MTIDATLFKRWEATWRALGRLSDPAPVLAEIVERYLVPERHYHTVAHVLDCLEKLDACTPPPPAKPEIAFALWLHDVVYDPQAKDNEIQSAKFSRAVLSRDGAPEDLIQRIDSLILATMHCEGPETGNRAVICDVDLAILGESADRFQEYNRQIALEYSWVPLEIYRQKRAEVLAGFLNRPRIYCTDYFYQQYEASARRNLADCC